MGAAWRVLGVSGCGSKDRHLCYHDQEATHGVRLQTSEGDV